MTRIRRLHWGCGDVTPEGWINSDAKKGPGVDVACDILDDFPFEDDGMDYIFSQHVLQEIKVYNQLDALRELRRVLKPGGVLRLCLPDLDLAIDAYRNGRREYFHIWDWDTISGNFITHVLWYSLNRALFTYEFAEELLRRAKFGDVQRVAYRQTVSPYPEIVELDDRKKESFYVEAFK